MDADAVELARGQSEGPVGVTVREMVTPEERLILRYYRQLDDSDRAFMRRVLEALAFKELP